MHGIGTDIVEIARVERWKDDEDLLSFVFSRTERDAALGGRNGAGYLAVAFAVKEAFMKATGLGWGSGLQWRDIEALDERRRVRLKLCNRAGELFGDRTVFASAGFTRDMALAVVTVGEAAGGRILSRSGKADADP